MNTVLNYQPEVLVDTADLSREDWLNYRRLGIGGSDAAAIMGVSPFATIRDLYFDKIGITPVIEEEEENWVAKEVGHRLEDLVAMIFAKKTGLEVFPVRKMFRHPLYPFMLADVDYFIRFPDVFLFLVYCSFSLLRTAGAYKWVPGSYIVPAIVRFFGLQAGVPCQIRKMHTWNRCIFVLFAVFSNNCKWHFVWQLWRKLQRDGCCHSSWRLCIKLSFRLAEGLAAHRMRHKHNE